MMLSHQKLALRVNKFQRPSHSCLPEAHRLQQIRQTHQLVAFTPCPLRVQHRKPVVLRSADSSSDNGISGPDKKKNMWWDNIPEDLRPKLLIGGGLILFLVIPFMQPTFLYKAPAGSSVTQDVAQVVPSPVQSQAITAKSGSITSISFLTSYFSSPAKEGAYFQEGNMILKIIAGAIFIFAFAQAINLVIESFTTVVGFAIKFVRRR